MKIFRIVLRDGKIVTVEGHSFGWTVYGYAYVKDIDGNEIFNVNSKDVSSILDVSKERQDVLKTIIPEYEKNTFIVHGYDEKAKYELKALLIELGLEPFILHEQDDKGLTIIEKFELYASQCSTAFVLLTPDEKSSSLSKRESQWRARQNVIMEMGWFMARLGRERVILLYTGEVEIPSDIYGVLYLHFNESVREVSEGIRRRLEGLGIIDG